MSAIRRWAVFDVFLGNPVLVERCKTREEAMYVAALRTSPSCGALFVVEQLLPGRPLILQSASAREARCGEFDAFDPPPAR
jgi:hypothetical protein